MKLRIESIDILRGWAIILVVVGHAGIYHRLNDILSFFHMPLFFFISGLFFKPIKGWSEILFRGGKKLRWKQLYIPFVTNMLLLMTLSPLLGKLQLTNTVVESFGEWLRNALVILRFRVGDVDLLGQYWFLPVMFFSNLFSLCVTKLVSRKSILMCLCLMLFLCGYYLSVNMKMNNPYDFSRVMYYSAFYMIGYVSKDTILKIGGTNIRQLPLGICMLIGILILWIVSGMSYYVYENGIVYFVMACVGISTSLLGAILICKFPQSNILAYIGRHTLAIFTYHVLVFKCVEYIMSQAEILTMSNGWHGAFRDNQYWWLYSIMGVCVPLSFVHFYRKIVKMEE